MSARTRSDHDGALADVLITGIPAAGKSTLADRLEGAWPGVTHVPLDRYIRAVPPGTARM